MFNIFTFLIEDYIYIYILLGVENSYVILEELVISKNV